jgi:hypothetical protein
MSHTTSLNSVAAPHQEVVDNWDCIAEDIVKCERLMNTGEMGVITNIKVAVRVRPLNDKVLTTHWT